MECRHGLGPCWRRSSCSPALALWWARWPVRRRCAPGRAVSVERRRVGVQWDPPRCLRSPGRAGGNRHAPDAIRAGESILTNIHDDHDREFIAHGVISAFARAFVSGHGIRVVRDSAAATGRDIREQAGYRAIAFWATGDTGLLDDLHADWLLVDPSRLTKRVRDALAHSPRSTSCIAKRMRHAGRPRGVPRRAPEAVETPPLTAAVTVVAVEFPLRWGEPGSRRFPSPSRSGPGLQRKDACRHTRQRGSPDRECR
jgi:hypothetical protein